MNETVLMILKNGMIVLSYARTQPALQQNLKQYFLAHVNVSSTFVSLTMCVVCTIKSRFINNLRDQFFVFH